jgi:hypothetical protein
MRLLFTALACMMSVIVVGQDCAFNSINIEVVGSDEEIGWNITQDNGWALVSGELGLYEDICLEDGCYPFNMYDGNGDGWIETTITISYSLTNEVIFSGTLDEGSVEVLNIQIGDSIECPVGCTDPTASNYDADATVDDGSCEYLPCDFFDVDGDYFLGANTWLFILGQYGTQITPSSNYPLIDADASGWIDMRDVLQYIPYQGENCSIEWADTTSGHIIGLALVESFVHEDSLIGIGSTLPPGSVTYHLYAQLSENTDGILAVYGDDESPLVLETTGSFYGFGSDMGSTIVIDDVNSVFNSIFPANAYTSWFTLGLEPDDNAVNTIGHIGGVANWTDGMASDGLIHINDHIGGGWMQQNSNYSIETDGFYLLGQFTVMGSPDFSGTINLLAETNSGSSIEFSEFLSFSSSSLAVFGCMNPQATNYDASATHEPIGICTYLGDFNGDGELTIDDFLDLLANFGCMDCPTFDLNSDGVISVEDILLFLTWI